MKILFLDQSGELGGAELALIDLVKPYRDSSLIVLFEEGLFCKYLEKEKILYTVLAYDSILMSKESGILDALKSIKRFIPLVFQVIKLGRSYDLIYANTPKAFVVAAFAAFIIRRPLVYHLHDILSKDHFSYFNIRLLVLLANRISNLIVANSQATKLAFIKAGGSERHINVVYNGFRASTYDIGEVNLDFVKKSLNLDGKFIVGHFSRISPWKGQHILLESLVHCPAEICALFVGGPLFGEEDYLQQLQYRVSELGLEHRVHFLGFRTDIPLLMQACNLIVHTSTLPEPFGRVIVEAMLCKKPVVAARDGGVIELIEHDKTGWLTTPGDALELATVIKQFYSQPEELSKVAHLGYIFANQTFNMETINHKIDQLLQSLIKIRSSS